MLPPLTFNHWLVYGLIVWCCLILFACAFIRGATMKGKDDGPVRRERFDDCAAADGYAASEAAELPL